MFLALREAKPALHLNRLLRRVQISAPTDNRARPSTELRLRRWGEEEIERLTFVRRLRIIYGRWRFRTRLNVILAGVMFHSLLAAAEAKWTAAGQWNQTDRAGANENPETNAVFALRSALSVMPKSGL